jgi:hypothetical protein
VPAPAKYAYLPDALRELALDARARGLSFEEFWHEALPVRECPACGAETLLPKCPNVVAWTVPALNDGAKMPVECGTRTRGPAAPTYSNPRGAGPQVLLWPTDAVERRAWLMGVDSAREGWRDAYERRPAERRHRALGRLAEGLRQLDGEGIDGELAVA